MRDRWCAIALLLRTAWRTDPWRFAALALEPLGFLRIPLFAWCLKLMVDGAIAHDVGQVAAGAAGIVVTRALSFAGGWSGSWIRNRLAEEVGFALNRRLATLMSELPGLEQHELPECQDRLELLRQQQGILASSINTLIYTANTVLAAVSILTSLAIVSPWLLVLVPFALPALPIATLHQRWLKDAEMRSAPALRRARHLQELTVDRNAGMELRVFGLAPAIQARFRQAWTEGRALALAAGQRAALLNSAGDAVFLTAFSGAVLWLLLQASRGGLSIGDVVMATFLAQQVRSSIVEPIRLVASLGEVLRSAGRMLWLEDYASRLRRTRAGTMPPPSRLSGGVVFDRVSFRYPGTDQWVLRNVSLRIPAGAVIAVVGQNGAGKTTLVKLLSRMYEPTEGRILVDGVDLATIAVDAWRERVSAAFQDFARPEFTAQQAVGFGDLVRVDDRDAVVAACGRADAAQVLTALPHGADTQLGARWPHGVDLSTGQWQKLALGRALMRDQPLVVFFDEPTASLDALAEHALFERYAGEARAGSARGAITVLVSHRFSTVRSADLIVVLDGGGISELGTHPELVRRDGLYAQLYQMQARAYA
ncbi:MAG TPA: ABC transporter ATP-binding protein [Vicinamibacterales bacterium]|nr:ABC transporter ATP-binding protein [Vicinamibacterales bacterium]